MTEHFCDEQENYYKIYIHLIMSIFTGMLQVLATNCFFASLSQHTVGLFNILR